MLKGKVLENVVIIFGLITVQVVVAGNATLMGYVMALGLNPLTIVIFCAFATFLVFTPLSIYYERNKWPKEFNLKLLIQLILISFGGVTLFQCLYLKGIKLTSPAMATAMPNLTPGLIFLIAAVLGFEKVEIRCMYSRVKIVGTSLCVIGALTLSLLQSGTNIDVVVVKGKHGIDLFNVEKLIGCMYLMAAVLALSINIVLQAVTLRDFPAPFSICASTSLIGVVISTIIELIQEHKFDTGWPILSVPEIIFFSLLGGTVSGACVSFNAWVMKKRGPVLVAMFTPVGTVISVLFSVIAVGDYITIGSLAGMFLMFTGLYFFLWAKGKEDYYMEESSSLPIRSGIDTPLLS